MKYKQPARFHRMCKKSIPTSVLVFFQTIGDRWVLCKYLLEYLLVNMDYNQPTNRFIINLFQKDGSHGNTPESVNIGGIVKNRSRTP